MSAHAFSAFLGQLRFWMDTVWVARWNGFKILIPKHMWKSKIQLLEQKLGEHCYITFFRDTLYVFAIIYLLTPYNHHPTPPHYWRGICEPLLMSLDNVEIMSCGEKIILNTNIVKLVKLNISLLFLRNKFSQRSGLWKPKLHLLSSEDSRENVQPYYQLWWL